jgi:dihydrofolate reductase
VATGCQRATIQDLYLTSQKETSMAKMVFGITMSLDGFINDRNGNAGKLGSDFEAFLKSEVMQTSIHNTGAVMMGRKTFEMADDPDSFADIYEYQVPIFVLTDRAPAKQPKENGRISFTFTNDIKQAVEAAKKAAGDKDVTVVGGANVGQQLLSLGLIDELQIDVMPILLGEGTRLFENLENEIELEKIKVIETGIRTGLVFRVKKKL